MTPRDELLPIPVSAAQEIAHRYGYDQVIVLGRRVGEEPAPHGEHVTTYGRSPEHCAVAARTGTFLKFRIMGWPEEEARPVIPVAPQTARIRVLAEHLAAGNGSPKLAQELCDWADSVAELLEAASEEADTTPEYLRADRACHYGITTAAKCGKCSREMRLANALARFEPMTPEEQAEQAQVRG